MTDGADNVTPIGAAKKRRAAPPSGDWFDLVIRDEKSGRPRSTLANAISVLGAHPAWEGVLARDLFASETRKLLPAPTRPGDEPAEPGPGRWTDTDSARTAAWLSSVADLDVGTVIVDQAVEAVAERAAFHPVREYLRDLQWDGEPRIGTWLSVHFGAEPTRYAEAIGARWLISAVARVMEPGVQADCMLILEGRQGSGKSTGVAALCPDAAWFHGTALDLGSKDAFQALRSKWLVEWQELDAMRGREATRVKAFVSASSDYYRASYARRALDYPRQCVFFGTTNEDVYLQDHTGNRRFWPVRTSGADVDRDAIRAVRDQLWAEAVEWYADGKAWHVDTAELRALCAAEQADREVRDPWVGYARSWALARRDRGITTEELLREGLEINSTHVNRAFETRAGQVLRALGFTDVRQVREGTDRVRRYFWKDEDPA